MSARHTQTFDLFDLPEEVGERAELVLLEDWRAHAAHLRGALVYVCQRCSHGLGTKGLGSYYLRPGERLLCHYCNDSIERGI